MNGDFMMGHRIYGRNWWYTGIDYEAADVCYREYSGGGLDIA